MQWNDWSILLSEVLGQFAIGAFIIIGGVMLSGKLCFGQYDRVMKVLPLICWLLIASLLIREATLIMGASHHVINPNTVMFVLVFVALTLIYSLCENKLIGKDRFRKAIVVILLLWSIAYIVDMLTFSANSGHFGAVLTIIFSVGFGGSILAHAMLVKAQHKVDPLNIALPIFGAFIGLVVLIVASFDLTALIDHTRHGFLVPFVWRIVSIGCLLLATGLWLMALLTKTKPVLAMLACACTLAVIASLTVNGSF